MPGDNALKKPMSEQQLPQQLQDARCVFYLETLYFGVLKGIYFSKMSRLWKNIFYWDESYV